MQHPNILSCDDVNQRRRLQVSNLYETWLKRQNVSRRRKGQRKRVRLPFPRNHPVRTTAPTILIDKERKVRVIQQELSLKTMDRDRLNILTARDKVEGCICGIKKGLGLLGRFQTEDFESLGTPNTEFGLEQVYRDGDCRDREQLYELYLSIASSIPMDM